MSNQSIPNLLLSQNKCYYFLPPCRGVAGGHVGGIEAGGVYPSAILSIAYFRCVVKCNLNKKIHFTSFLPIPSSLGGVFIE